MEFHGCGCRPPRRRLGRELLLDEVGQAAHGLEHLGGDLVGPAVVSYSTIESASPWPGVGNINDPPRFLNSGVTDFERYGVLTVSATITLLADVIVEAPDLRVEFDSPIVDAGTADGAPAADINGMPRPRGDGIDMGAFENRGTPEFLRGDSNDEA